MAHSCSAHKPLLSHGFAQMQSTLTICMAFNVTALCAFASGSFPSLQTPSALQVLAWDVRGSAGMLGMQRHAQLAAVDLRAALGRLPRLAAQTAVPPAQVNSLALDPGDPGRIAFHLSGGWSGVESAERDPDILLEVPRLKPRSRGLIAPPVPHPVGLPAGTACINAQQPLASQLKALPVSACDPLKYAATGMSPRPFIGLGSFRAVLASCSYQSFFGTKHHSSTPGRTAGALDVVRERITHAHCPPLPLFFTYADGLRCLPPAGTRPIDKWRRRASWAAAQGPFCVGTAAGGFGVHLLDFASAASPCAVGALPIRLGPVNRCCILAARVLTRMGTGRSKCRTVRQTGALLPTCRTSRVLSCPAPQMSYNKWSVRLAPDAWRSLVFFLACASVHSCCDGVCNRQRLCFATWAHQRGTRVRCG